MCTNQEDQGFNTDRRLREKHTMHTDEINRIIHQAKQQRAEVIGSAIRSRPVSVAVIAAMSLVFVQFAAEPIPEHAREGHVVQIAGFAG